MSITIQDILTNLGNRSWSGYDIDDMVFGALEADRATTELNVNHRYLMSLYDFPYQIEERELTLLEGSNNLTLANAQIEGVTIDGISLQYLDNPENIKDKTVEGTPTHYYMDYDGLNVNIVFYPIADKEYTAIVRVNDFMFVQSSGGTVKQEFTEATDILKMPEYLNYLYMDCLVLRTMLTSNKDVQDENYAPTKEEFRETWANFCNKANPTGEYIRNEF